MHSKVIQSATLQPPVDPSAACSAGHATHQRNTSCSPIGFLKLPPPPCVILLASNHTAPISSTIGMISWDDAIFQLLSVLSRKPTLGKKKGFHVSAPMLRFMSGMRARLGIGAMLVLLNLDILAHFLAAWHANIEPYKLPVSVHPKVPC